MMHKEFLDDPMGRKALFMYNYMVTDLLRVCRRLASCHNIIAESSAWDGQLATPFSWHRGLSSTVAVNPTRALCHLLKNKRNGVFDVLFSNARGV
jgi:hypothetical protein